MDNVEWRWIMRHPLRTTALLSLLAYVGGIAALLAKGHRGAAT